MACVVFLNLLSAKADIAYRLTDLGTLGGHDSRAMSINNHGDVVGWAFTGYEEIRHAYKYSAGSIQDLRPTDPRVNEAHGINENGSVVGWTIANNRLHASVWQNGVMTDIDPNGLRSSANAINAGGVITGDANFGGNQHAFRFSGGNWEDLGTLGGSRSFGTAINTAGQIVGCAYTASGQRHTFSYSGMGPLLDLGTLGGAESQANGINDAGDVVGWASDVTGNSRAFIYRNGHMNGLGTLGGVASAANDINNYGDIVGWWSPNGFNRFAFTTINGYMVPLNSLIDQSTGWTLVEATAINDSGSIVGFGIDPQGVDRAFLLTPVPTPSALTTFALVTLVGFRRYR